MFNFRRKRSDSAGGLHGSQLHNETTFYDAFARDIKSARSSVIIESPFITSRRLATIYPLLKSAVSRGVHVIVNTRDPITHDQPMGEQATHGIEILQQLGVTILFTANHHRKIAIIDHRVLWEGSLNILSQNDSCEVMRRIASTEVVEQMIQFTALSEWYAQEQL